MNCSSVGAEMTSTTLSWWMLAMIAFPEVQRRAQAEIDAVVGRDRLPSFADAPHLPYVCATMKEILRWRHAVALGVPHVATNEDWYEGMYIPKGTMCIAICGNVITIGQYSEKTQMNSGPNDTSTNTESWCLGLSKHTRQDMSRLVSDDGSA